MTAESIRLFVIVALLIAAAAWVVTGFFTRAGGTWERVLTPEEERDGARRDRLELVQLGPLVTGQTEVVGGRQVFSGFLILRSLTLHRRDHGPHALKAMGFPDAIARKLDGEVMGRLRLRFTEDHLLVGTFEPRKIEFTHQPPRVTAMHYLEGQARRYRRVVPALERVPPLEEARAEGPPA